MTSPRPSARARLLETADRLFYTEGVHTVGIDRVIAEAGVAKGSLFYNFAGKDDLVAAYLARRDERRRARIARHVAGLTDPRQKVLAVFDALGEAVADPAFNGCAFANANAEASPDGVEATALRTFRGWLRALWVELAEEAGFAEPAAVADRLQVLYDGAVASAHLDGRREAVQVAKELADRVLEDAALAGR